MPSGSELRRAKVRWEMKFLDMLSVARNRGKSLRVAPRVRDILSSNRRDGVTEDWGENKEWANLNVDTIRR